MKYAIKIYEVDYGEHTLPELYDNKDAAILAGHRFCELTNPASNSVCSYFRVVPATAIDITRNKFYEEGYPISF